MTRTAAAPGMRHVSPRLGWLGTLTVAWALAGGIAGGGFVAVLLLNGMLHPEAALLVTAVFSLLGSALGSIHGAVLGHIGRPANAETRTTWLERALTVTVTTAAVVTAVLLAFWLTMAAVLVRTGIPAGWLALALGAAAALAAIAWATVLGWHAIETAFARWPRRRLGVMLVGGAFVVIAAVLLLARPALPGTQLRMRFTTAIAVSALTTLWLATPAAIFALRLTDQARRQRTPHDDSCLAQGSMPPPA